MNWSDFFFYFFFQFNFNCLLFFMAKCIFFFVVNFLGITFNLYIFKKSFNYNKLSMIIIILQKLFYIFIFILQLCIYL
jgi:hypothetical protein